MHASRSFYETDTTLIATQTRIRDIWKALYAQHICCLVLVCMRVHVSQTTRMTAIARTSSWKAATARYRRRSMLSASVHKQTSNTQQRSRHILFIFVVMSVRIPSNMFVCGFVWCAYNAQCTDVSGALVNILAHAQCRLLDFSSHQPSVPVHTLCWIDTRARTLSHIHKLRPSVLCVLCEDMYTTGNGLN